MVKPPHDTYRQVLASVVGELHADYQRVLQLRLIEECSVAETAQLLRTSEKGVEFLYREALRALRSALKDKQP